MVIMNPTIIGNKLRNLRKERSVEEVAKSVNISCSALRMYETGKRIPRDEIKISLARYYEVSIEELFFKDCVHEM